MGGALSSINCKLGLPDCFETSSELKESPLQDRLARLHTGGRFLQKAYLGLSSKEIEAKLSEDNTVITWKTVNVSSWSSIEKGTIDLTKVTKIQEEDPQGFVFLMEDGSEIWGGQAETKGVRDLWVSLLQELLDSWNNLEEEERPEAKLTAETTNDKTAYWAERQANLDERKKTAEEKKKKYNVGGFKHTAVALANRS